MSCPRGDQPATTEPEVLLRPIHAAARLGISRSRLYEMLNAHSAVLPSVRIGRTIRIRSSVIDRAIAEGLPEIPAPRTRRRHST